MSQATPIRSSSISLDDLIALNDEIAALARAGIPLEKGLLAVGGDLPGRLGRIATSLAERMQSGETLPQAVSASRDQFPPVYRAVVEAGLRSGRLTVALEGLATLARRLAEIRRVVSLAMLYPLLVVLLAGGLFAFYVTKILPIIVMMFERHAPALLRFLAWLGTSAPWWGRALPVVVLLLFGIWWYQTKRSLVLQAGRGGLAIGWMPAAGRMVQYARLAALSEILALLLEHEVPFPAAIVLAADATGDPRLGRSAEAVAASLAQGGDAEKLWREARGFPPLLRWLLAIGHRQQTLVPLLKHSAENYRLRALRQAEWLRTFVPVALTILIGGTTVLVYGLTLFVPLTELMKYLALSGTT